MNNLEKEGTLSNIDGLGPKAINSIKSYFQNKASREAVIELLDILDIQSYDNPKLDNKFSGKNIVFYRKTIRTLKR